MVILWRQIFCKRFNISWWCKLILGYSISLLAFQIENYRRSPIGNEKSVQIGHNQGQFQQGFGNDFDLKRRQE
jgi:hypothetical protein